MFWRSVVGKLAITILLLVSFVLLILTVLLLEFFENFHTQEAENELILTAEKVSTIIEQNDHQSGFIEDTLEGIKDPSSQVVVIFEDYSSIISQSTHDVLSSMDENWFRTNQYVQQVLSQKQSINEQITLPNSETEIMLVGNMLEDENAAVFVYQTLDVIEQTKAETTRIIFLAAGIAIVLTTFFAFFLSTRITSPLIKMREAAFDLTRGEFNTKVPILTHDEIGELAIAFNRMGRQLKFHINALRQEKEQLSSIVSSMADGVITLNRHGDIIVINPPAEKFLEDWYYEHNLEGKKMALPNDLKEILEQIIAGEKQILKELSIQGRNWVVIMTPLYDQKKVRGAVAVIRDMTEERRLDKLRKDFISNVSHELRTPISLLQGYSEAIIDDIAETKEEKNELAKIIQEESLRMGRLVNELLDMGRMEAGHISLHKEKVVVEDFINRILNKFSHAFVNQDLTLKLEKDIKVPSVVIDPDRIEQVLTNLIDNAIAHTSDDGMIQVTVKSDHEELRVDVKDNGRGIPEEDLPFIFERFYKADKSRKRDSKKQGTGLGLAIAKHIIDAHHGHISVKSKQEVGTTFSFVIPHATSI